MDRIALISDIHGNLEALKVVLSDIKKRGVTHIFCLGDTIGKGTHPNECLDLIKENCEVILKGNVDEYFFIQDDLSKLSKKDQIRTKWNKEIVSIENQEFLLNLPLTHEFYMSGSLVRIFHASAKNCYAKIHNRSLVNEKLTLFMPSEHTKTNKQADIVIYGHIHMQYMDRFYNKTVLNTGSVGHSYETIRNRKYESNNKETTKAHYLILSGTYQNESYGDEISFEFIRVPYDIEKEIENSNENPEKEQYEKGLRDATYETDMMTMFKEKGYIGGDIDE